jgi:hypothetical protein
MRYIYVHVVPYDDSLPGNLWYKFPVDRAKYNGFDYRSRTSINAYFYSGKSRNWAPNCKPTNYDTLYHATEEFDFNLRCELKEQKLIELESVYDFFKEIGYDYKSKKYKRS